MADRSNPHNQVILISGLLSGLFLIFVSVALTFYFKTVTQQELRVKVELAPNRELEELRLREERMLGNYALVDAGEKLARIPIERAMHLESIDPRPPIVPATAPSSESTTGSTTVESDDPTTDTPAAEGGVQEG